jgi:hypothetical protein
MSSSAYPSAFPPVDARLVAPESGYEVEDGGVVKVSPSDDLHGIRHSKLSALLEAHVAHDYEVASDMLTRLTEIDDIAPDASVFPQGRDPATGGRYIEELAFQVLNTEKLSAAAKQAVKLTARGVRRVFAIDVVRLRFFEWSPEVGWAIGNEAGCIEDRALAVPLPIAALVHSAKADDAMARALLAKQNPVLHAALLGTALAGKIEGKAEALLTILRARGLQPSGADEERIRASSEAELDARLVSALACSGVAELFEG